jgi:hypothetical protein
MDVLQFSFASIGEISKDVRLIHKIMKTQHQNPEFGHKQGEIKKTLQKRTLVFKGDDNQAPFTLEIESLRLLKYKIFGWRKRIVKVKVHFTQSLKT